jgi:hypothetical protein
MMNVIARTPGSALILGVMVSSGFSAAAQDATPGTAPAAGPVGVSSTLLGSGEPSLVPGHELILRRVTIEPGGRLPSHTHPGAMVIYLEAGTWGYIPLQGVAQLTRAAVDGTPSPTEDMVLGTETMLQPGDVIYVEDPGDDIRNAGEDQVVLWVAGLTPVGVPFTTLMPDMDMAMGSGTSAP